MNEKGFTLIELLAVIVIIGLLASFALPQITNQFANNQENLNNQKMELIKESARSYVLSNAKKYTVNSKTTLCMKEVQAAGLLEKNLYEEAQENGYNAFDVTYNGTSVDVVLKSDESCQVSI